MKVSLSQTVSLNTVDRYNYQMLAFENVNNGNSFTAMHELQPLILMYFSIMLEITNEIK